MPETDDELRAIEQATPGQTGKPTEMMPVDDLFAARRRRGLLNYPLWWIQQRRRRQQHQ